MVDHIKVKRTFSPAKRCYVLGLIRLKLDTTTRISVALSVIAMNMGRLVALVARLSGVVFSRYMADRFTSSDDEIVI